MEILELEILMIYSPFPISGIFDAVEDALKRSPELGTTESKAADNSINGCRISFRCFSCSQANNTNEQNKMSSKLA